MNALDISTIPRVGGGYGTILIDPPWPYDQKLDTSRTRGGAEKHYLTLSLEDIESLPIGLLASTDCMLWLWTTNTHLHAAFHTIATWGFTYKVMATWVKTRFGLGYWLRGKTEHLLLAVRGKPRLHYIGPHGAMGSQWSTLLDEIAEDDAVLMSGKWNGHSRKPESSYEMIEALSPKPRLELFARRNRDGWTSWGDQLLSDGPHGSVVPGDSLG